MSKQIKKLEKNKEDLINPLKLVTKRINFPRIYKDFIENLQGDGSKKSVVEYALRKFMTENKPHKSKKESYPYPLVVKIPTELMDEINSRIPEQFLNFNHACLTALINLLLENKGEKE